MNKSYGVAYGVRASAVLTNGYVAGTILSGKNVGTAQVAANPESYNQLEIWCDFTKGSLNSASIMVEFSWDGSTYFQETFSSISGGTDTLTLGVHTISASGLYRFSVPFKAQYVKISAIGTGTVTNSLLAITAVLGLV